MFIDTHGHVQFNSYKEDADAIIQRAFDANIAVIAPGSQIDTSRRAVEYAERWKSPWLWAAVGLHPIHLEEMRVDTSEVENQFKFLTRKEEFSRAAYEELLESDKVVAVGEIGLDYWYKPKSKTKREAFRQKQFDAFRAQLVMAADHKLPLILHCRVAHDDMLDVLREHDHAQYVNPPGVVHSYTGSLDQLKGFLELGYAIGVNGLVFKLPFVAEAVTACPLDNIVLETDAPYLTPPNAPTDRNEPSYLPLIAQRVAELKGVSIEEVEKQTTKNAQKLFRRDFSTAT